MMRKIVAAAALVTLASSPAFAGRDGARKTPAEIAAKIMERFDADRDGRITRKEAEGGPRLQRHFDRMDANRDGSLTQAELQAAIEKRRERKPDRDR